MRWHFESRVERSIWLVLNGRMGKIGEDQQAGRRTGPAIIRVGRYQSRTRGTCQLAFNRRREEVILRWWYRLTGAVGAAEAG